MEDKDFSGKEKKSGKIIAILVIICILLVASLLIIFNVAGKKSDEVDVNETDFSSLAEEDIEQSIYNTNGIESSDDFSSKSVNDFSSFEFSEKSGNPDGTIGFESFEKNGFEITDNDSQLDGMEYGIGNNFNTDDPARFYDDEYNDEIERQRLAEIEGFAETDKKQIENGENNINNYGDSERQKIAESERKKIEDAEKQVQAERQRIADVERKRLEDLDDIGKLAAAEKALEAESQSLAEAEKIRAEQAKAEEAIRIAAEQAKAEEAIRIASERAKAEEARRVAAEQAKAEEAKRVAAAEKAEAERQAKAEKTESEKRVNAENTRIAEAKRQKSAELEQNRDNDNPAIAKNTDNNLDKSPKENDSLNSEYDKTSDELEKLFTQYENSSSNSEKQAILSKALPLSQKVISEGKKNSKAHFFLSRDYYNKRRFNDAISELNNSIAIEENYLYYHELGKLRYMSKDYNGAIAAFKKACQLNASFAPSRYNLGLSYVKVNKIDQGLSCYKQAVAIKPDYVQAHLGMARLYKQVKYYDDAIKSYRKAIDIDSKNIPARMDLGVIYSDRGDFDNAISVYTDALKYVNEGEMQTIIKYNLSIALFNKGDFEKALEIAKESYDEKDYLKDANSKSNVVYNYGLIFETLGRIDDAITMYNETLDIYRAHLKAKVNLSVIYMNLENPNMDEVFRLLNEAYVVAPYNFEVNNNLGNAYVLNGDYNTAIVYFETALNANPKDKVVKQNLANAYLKAEDYENAEIIYREILGSDSKNWQANLDIAKVYVQLGDNDSAKKYLEFIKNNKPDFKPEEVNGLLGAL